MIAVVNASSNSRCRAEPYNQNARADRHARVEQNIRARALQKLKRIFLCFKTNDASHRGRADPTSRGMREGREAKNATLDSSKLTNETVQTVRNDSSVSFFGDGLNPKQTVLDQLQCLIEKLGGDPLVRLSDDEAKPFVLSKDEVKRFVVSLGGVGGYAAFFAKLEAEVHRLEEKRKRGHDVKSDVVLSAKALRQFLDEARRTDTESTRFIVGNSTDILDRLRNLVPNEPQRRNLITFMLKLKTVLAACCDRSR